MKTHIAAALVGVLSIQSALCATFDGVDIAPGDLHAKDLTKITCVREVKGDPIVIVKDGVAQLPIVWNGPAALNTPARFLADVIFRMTGVRPKVIREREGQPVKIKKAFFIGETSAAKAAGLLPFRKTTWRWGGVDAERFRVVAKDGSFFFVGRGDYGVYDWCERQLDIRYYWPEVPNQMYRVKGTNRVYGLCTTETKGLAARPVDYEDQPVYACRNNWPYGGTPWNLCAKGGDSHRGGVNVHAPASWNKDKELVAKHPDIFVRTIDGQRAVSPMLCYGNPKTLEYYKQRIDEHIAGKRDSGGIVNTDKRVITVSQWDLAVFCSCEHCMKLFDQNLGNATSASPILWNFFTTELAKWLKEKHPDYVISTLPYKNTCGIAPGFDVSKYGNVEAMLCTMPGLAMLKNEKCKKHEEDLIRSWVKVTGKPVLNWHYSCWPAEFTSAPYLYGETIKKHYSDMKGLVSGTFINGHYDTPRMQLSGYVWMRCLWNPDIDVQAVYDEFCRRMFGKASSTMRKLLDMQETGWNRQWGSNMCSIKNVFEISYPRKEVIEMQSLLERAKKEVAGDVKASARVEWYASGFKTFFKESEENSAGTAFAPFMMKKADIPPRLDGKLDDHCWTQAEGRTFVHAHNKTNSASAYPTEVKAVWDDRGITFGVRCTEPAVDKMNLGAAQQDPWGQDSFEIFMDCSGTGDGHWYQLLIDINERWSPFTDGPTWEPKGVKVKIFPGKGEWTMEVYVPFSDLRGFENAQIPTTSANGIVWIGNLIRWRVGDMKMPKEKRVKDSHNEMSRMNTRYSHWNKDPGAFGKFVFIE